LRDKRKEKTKRKHNMDDEMKHTMTTGCFSGEAKHWEAYKNATLGMAEGKLIDEAFTTEKTYITKEQFLYDPEDGAGKTKKEKFDFEANLKAYSYLMITCSGAPNAFGMIKEAKGSAYIAWKALTDKYEGSNVEADLSVLWNKLQKMKFTDYKDPDDYFREAMGLNARMKAIGKDEENKMTDMQMKLVFFSTLPPEYTVVRSKYNRIIESTPIDTIITDIKDHHGMFNAKEDTTETGLALMGQHTDSEKCKHCGRNNHKTDDCFYKNGRSPSHHEIYPRSLATTATRKVIMQTNVLRKLPKRENQ
jgi:hypothetical protein